MSKDIHLGPKELYEQLSEISHRFNDFSFWYPLLKRIDMRTPKSEIIYTDVELVHLLDGVAPEGYQLFLNALGSAALRVRFPCFLRTGQLSNKHDWKRSCYLDDAGGLAAHVTNLVEMSCMANIAGRPFPYSTWVVRELIPTRPLFHAFYDSMPITKEFRFFIRDGKVQCHHPYWSEEAFECQPDNGWKSHIAELQTINSDDEAELTSMALYVAGYFPGYWSADFLQAADGMWWLTDMALGTQSYHYPNCEFDKDKGHVHE